MMAMNRFLFFILAFAFIPSAFAEQEFQINGQPFLWLGDEVVLVTSANGPYYGNVPRLDYFPDEGTSLLPSKNKDEATILLSVGKSSWKFSSGSIVGMNDFAGYEEVFKPDTASTWQNGYTGMSGVWVNSTGKVWGFYHAEDQKNMPNIPGTQIPGFYASIGVAVSSDTGSTWTAGRRLIVSHTPKNVATTASADQGAAEAGVVASPDGKFVYVDYSDHARLNGMGVFIGLARIPIQGDSLDLDACKKWDGSQFSYPCDGGLDVPVIQGKDVMGSAGDALEGHPVWSNWLQKYMMVLGAYDYASLATTLRKSGTYVMLSDDMIHWAHPTRILEDWPVVFASKSLRWEASILWTNKEQQSAWLVYGQTDAWPDGNGNGAGSKMVGRGFALLMDAEQYAAPLKSPSRLHSLAKPVRFYDLLGRTNAKD